MRATGATHPARAALSGISCSDAGRLCWGSSVDACAMKPMPRDAVQETSLRLLRYRSQPGLAAPEALMFRVAQSVVSDHFRQRSVRHAQDHVPIADLELVADLPTHEQTVSGEEELRLLVAAIQELKPKCRQAFLMSRLHGLTYPQIAERMGLSEQMVAKYISTALLHCRIKVEG